jgi:hypothetical protein
MKILTTVNRVVLGLILKLFGLNGFLHFIPTPPPAVAHVIGALLASRDLPSLFAVASIGGTFLVLNRQVPVMTALLGPVVGNILLPQLVTPSAGLAVACLIALLWLTLFISVRSALAELVIKTCRRLTKLFRNSEILPEAK